MGTRGGTIGLCTAYWSIKKMIKPSKIYKMRIVFHLAPDAPGRADLVETLRTMIQKSRLPFARAKQNHTLPRIAYGPGIKRGQFAAR